MRLAEKLNWKGLMLYTEIITDCSKNHPKTHKCTLAKNVEFIKC
jgi:hypothetical protein